MWINHIKPVVLEVELDVAVLHDGGRTPSCHGARVYVFRRAKGVPERATIGTKRD